MSSQPIIPLTELFQIYTTLEFLVLILKRFLIYCTQFSFAPENRFWF